MRHLVLWFPTVLLSSLSLFAVTPPQPPSPPTTHLTTEWRLRPSLKYDALCLLNVLSGDPYYLEHYQAEYDHFHPLFSSEEQAAFGQLKRIIKDEGGGIVSARLALYYSAVNDETLPQLIRTAHDSSAMKAALQKTPYWSDEEWNNYEKARPALEKALSALNRVGFAGYWRQDAKPKADKRIAEISKDLPKYNIVPVIEQYIGFPLPSNVIVVYLLNYSKPHGIRITGLRFLSHESYPFTILLHNAIHESMHPPYQAKDPAVREAIDILERDPIIVDKVQHHNPAFGYNTTSGYIEEDSVQALEQIISEQFGVGRDALKYWEAQDDRMHVLAAALYVQYREARKQAPQTYSAWFVHAVAAGQLQGEKLRHTIDQFFAGSSGK